MRKWGFACADSCARTVRVDAGKQLHAGPNRTHEGTHMLTDTMLTVAEAAKAMGVGRSTVYAEMDAGNLPYVKIRTSRRIRASDVDAYLAEHTHGGELGRVN